MAFNKELIDKIIKLIDVPREFGACMDEYDDYCEVADDYSYILKDHNIDAEVRFGCTRLVIIPKNSDYVIKIPFNGKFEIEYPDPDDDDYGENVFYRFHNANDIELEDAEDWDYCENEVAKYEDAVSAGFGNFFLDTYLYKYKNGNDYCYPIYVQKKVNTVCSNMFRTDFKPVSEHTSNYYHEHRLDFTCVNKNWTLAAMEYYGIEKVKSFFQYLVENHLNGDLHSGNVGFNAEGAPVLLDWAGYRDGWDW